MSLSSNTLGAISDIDITAIVLVLLARHFCHWQPGPASLHRQGLLAVPPVGDGVIASITSHFHWLW